MAPRQEVSHPRASGREYFSPTSHYGVRSARAAMTPGRPRVMSDQAEPLRVRSLHATIEAQTAKPGKPFTHALFWRIMGFESAQYIRRVARDVPVFSTVHVMRHRPERRRALYLGRSRASDHALRQPQARHHPLRRRVAPRPHLGRWRRVRLSAPPAGRTRRSSSMRMPPKGASASTSFQSTSAARASPRAAARAAPSMK